MKQILFLSLAAALLAACGTSTTSSVVTYDDNGREISSQTTVTRTNDAKAAAKEIGHDVKEGVISGYEWTKDKAVEGYQWVKETSVNAYDSIKN